MVRAPAISRGLFAGDYQASAVVVEEWNLTTCTYRKRLRISTHARARLFFTLTVLARWNLTVVNPADEPAESAKPQ